MNISLKLSIFFQGGQNSDLDSGRDQAHDKLSLPSDTTLYSDRDTNLAMEIIH